MGDEGYLRKVFYCILIISAISAYIIVIIVIIAKNNHYYYSVLVLPLILGVIAYKLNRKANKLRIQKDIRKNWGKEQKRKINFESIRSLFDIQKNKTAHYIDNQTWLDFDMDKVFQKLDRTLSTPGEQVLYNLLRTPITKGNDFINRCKLINFFQKEVEIREKIQTEMHFLGKENKSDITSIVFGEIIYNSALKPLVNMMLPISIICIVLCIIAKVSLSIILLVVVCISCVNGYINTKVKRSMSGQIQGIIYLGNLIKSGINIGEIENETINEYTKILKENSKECASIVKALDKGKLGRIEGIDNFYEYINILLLLDVRAFYKVVDEVKLKSNKLKQIYMMLGQIDALISIASYRDGLEHYIEPKLIESANCIKATDLKHPLLENPVGNPINVEKGVIITGSNMSGKSTFLRALGINALFAQTICTCLAESYESGYFYILSSMNVSDDVTGGKSFYLGEAEAIHRIIKVCNEKTATLCFIDEIFKGTNPIERVNASAEILYYLAQHNCLVGVATHDLEIPKMVGDLYETYYFTEDVGERGLEFDYKIRKGISSTRNAIKVLEFIGYPKEIIDKTNKRISGDN